MTATPPAYWSSQVPPSRWTAGRIVALVFAILLLVPGIGLVIGGGVLLWADLGNRTDGYVFSETAGFSTAGYALTSERIDLATGADWLPLSAALGDARAEVASTDPGTEIFVGIARAADAAAYLEGVERSVIDDLGTTAIDEVVVPGGEPSGPPGDEDIWVAQASGSGTQRLDWAPAAGNWQFVVMNADASSGVSIDARIGATVPALGGLAWGVLGLGVFLLLVGTLLLVLALRRPRVEIVGPPHAGMHYGTPPPYMPPAPVDRSTAADARPDTTTSTPPGGSTPG